MPQVEHFDIEENEVYTIEMSFTTGEDGKCSGKDGIVTVYRRAVDVTYMLKLKAARQLFSEINSTSPTLAFGMREFEGKLGATAKLGLKEINEHSLLHPYYVLVDKPTETIATFKCTCLVLPSGVVRLTGAEYPKVNTEKKILDEEVRKLLLGSLKNNNKKKTTAKKDEKKAEEKK
jgi:methionine aminopeptidase